MANLFSSPTTAAKQATKAMGIQMQGSQYGPAIPVLYGRNKTAGNCLWYGDFQAIEHQQNVGGKGGGATSTSYTYSASFQLGLCEGPIVDVRTIYAGTSTISASQIGAVFATGAIGQAPWSHLSSPFNLGYSHTALFSVQNLALGSSASLPNYNFEVDGLKQYSSSIPDANPADILTDICTDTEHGIGFSLLGSLTQYSDYCVATGLFLSPVYAQQQSANQALSDLFKWTNSYPYFSENQLKVVPLGDQTVTGNGVTYTPNVTPVVDLGPDDLLVQSPTDPPVQIDRSAPADAMNIVRVEFQDRSQSYHTSGVVASIDEDVITNGARADQSVQIDACTDGNVARFIAQNMVQRAFFVRNTYTFRLGWRYCYLEPTDIVTLTDATTGLNQFPVRITQVEEDDQGTLTITAEEFPEGIGHSASYAYEAPNGTIIDTNVDPGAVNSPFLFRGPGFLLNGSQPEIWCAVNGSGQYWAGSEVYLSYDGTSYEWLGTYTGGARYGFIESGSSLPVGADPDTTNTPTVQLNAPGTLTSVSQTDADNFNTLAIVDSEVISYETAALQSADAYQLSYLRRGGYGSAIASHAALAPFARLDDKIIRIPVDPSLIGTTVYLKFLSINSFGRTPRTLASETAYTYVVGTNEELPDVPVTPANFATAGVADGVSIIWTNSNPAAVGCTSIEYATAATGPWTVLAQVGPTGTSYHHSFTNGATYYYRARARGILVSSGWSAYTSVYNSTGTNVGAISATANQALTDAEQALTNAATALSAADGKAEITVGTTAPSSPRAGDIWYDTSVTPDAAYVWNGSAWAPADSAAQAQAATAASAASAASTLAGTKAEVTIGSTAPSGPHTGDIWYDTATSPEAAYAWNGSAWVSLDSYAQGLANNAQNTATTAAASMPVYNGRFPVDLSGWNFDTNSAGEWYRETGANSPDSAINTYLVHAGQPSQTTTTAHDFLGGIAVTEGQSVSASIALREVAANAGSRAYARIGWLNASYVEITNSTQGVNICSPDSGYFSQGVSRVFGTAPAGAVRAVLEIEFDNHTSGYYTATNGYISGQPATLDEVGDSLSYVKSPVMGGSAIVVPNANFLAPVDKAGNIPGWSPANGATLAYFTTNASPFTNTQCLHVTSPGPSPAGFGAGQASFKADAGDTFFIKGWIYSESGALGEIILYYFGAPGGYLGQTTVAGTAYGSWQQVSGSGVAPAGTAQAFLRCFNPNTDGGGSYFYGIGVSRAQSLDNEVVDGSTYLRMPGANMDANRRGLIDFTQSGHLGKTVDNIGDGTTYARIYGSELSSGKHRIGVAGSGYRVGDQRNLPAVTVSNYGSGWSGLSLSYSATTTSATISASAATLQEGSNPISYNASSVTVSGSAGTTVNYYLYYQDAARVGGSQTLYATTSQITSLNNDANVSVATLSVTFPASGTGSGGGTGYCPLRTAWVIRRGHHGRPQYVRAGKVHVGDWLLRSDGEWAEVTYSKPELQACVRVVADGFGTLGCSISAPLQTADGQVLSREALGREVVVQSGSAIVSDLRGLGDQWVQHITLSNAPDDFYLVGDAKTALFAHHNMKPP